MDEAVKIFSQIVKSAAKFSWYNCWQVMWDTMGLIKKNTEFKQKYGEAALGKATQLFYRETWENHEPNF